MTDIAVYAGSFDPFTNGHMDIVKKAARLFAHLYVVIATNTEKPRAFDAAQMRDAIERTLTDAGISNCTGRCLRHTDCVVCGKLDLFAAQHAV